MNHQKISLFIAIFIAIAVISSPRTLIASDSNLNISNGLKLIIFGDMMFDRGVKNAMRKNGKDYVWSEAPSLIKNFDITVANLEGPITPYPSRVIGPNGERISKLLEFTFPTSTAPDLRDAGIDIVSLANNHSQNFGQNGLNLTRSYLKDVGVQYFGSPQNSSEISTSTCKNGICIGLIGYHEFAYKNEQKIIKEIAKLKLTNDFVIIYPHWGVEYKKFANDKQGKLARAWIDAGADAVIGSHPHVVQDFEFYKGRLIYYSLGNFIFDQYFSYDTTHAVGLELDFSKVSTGGLAGGAGVASESGKAGTTTLNKVIEHHFSNKDYSIKFSTTTEIQTPAR